MPPQVAIVSFRLGGSDGVAIVAATWQRALASFGFEVRTVAGEGPVDVLVPGLAIEATVPPTEEELERALAGADLVVVENLLTIPLNLPAALVLARVLRGRPAILHHHDPAWQRVRFAHVTELPPTDPAWVHVTINDLTREQLAERGIEAVTIRNGFDAHPAPGDRAGTRAALGVTDDELLLLHPVRAIARKDVPAAVRLAEALGATYWITGPPEEGYGPELARILAGAGTRVLEGRPPGATVDDLYAASDAVAFPSTWEGFGNPPIEASLRLRPVAVGAYPVAQELRALGFRWFDADDPAALAAFLAAPDPARLEHDRDVARRHLSIEVMTAALRELLVDSGLLAREPDGGPDR